MFIFQHLHPEKCTIFEALERGWFQTGNIVLVCPQRQKNNLFVTENAVSCMYKSAKYIEKQQQVSAGIILYNRASAFVGSLAKPDHLYSNP
jgi:hypothetical protein